MCATMPVPAGNSSPSPSSTTRTRIDQSQSRGKEGAQTIVIRPAREDDLPVLQEIERQAGRVFTNLGMTAVADDEPPALEVLRDYQRAGRAWVYVDADDIPATYLLAEVVDGCAHIEQVSVQPDHARKGIGRALIEHLAQ